VNDWGYLDTLGAWDEAAVMPEHLIRAHRAAEECIRAAAFALPTAPRAVVAFAQGTAATAADAVAAVTARYLAVPFTVVRGSEVPAYVDEHTLAFVVSTSGETEEVLAAAGAAGSRGAVLVGLGPAGVDSSLDRVVRENGRAGSLWCPLASARTPRAGLGAATVSMLAVLDRCGLIPGAASSITAAAGALAPRRDVWMTRGGEPELLARRLGRTIPLVYGADGVAAVAARWWKAGVNLNAKAPSFAASVPSLTYDELAGWGQSGDVTRQTMSLVFLRHAGEPALAGPLFGAVRAATDEIMANLFDVHAEGEDDLGRFFDLALLGELVSLHLAGREGVDPGPAPAVAASHPTGAARLADAG
jgi:glucose/mannose-6-phosphate isomerase